MNKGYLNRKIYDIIDEEHFYRSRDLFQETDNVAVTIDRNGEQITLPYNQKGTVIESPGIYNQGVLDIIVYPTQSQVSQYTPEIIDFDHIESIKDFNEKKDRLNNMEKEVLTMDGKDNVFRPPLLDTDTPEMRAIKEAIISKNIDLDKYSDRYGNNYPNDKRKYKDDNITLFLIKRTCECLDMRAQLIIEDKNPDVVNPIGRRIVADLTSGFDSDEA